jgi:tRNA(fMet)-specific endonuclease VapC
MKDLFEALTILPVSPIFDLYAEEKARLTLAGTPTGDFDLLIGCTAVSHKMVLVTENVDDFKNIRNVEIENWVDRSL